MRRQPCSGLPGGTEILDLSTFVFNGFPGSNYNVTAPKSAQSHFRCRAGFRRMPTEVFVLEQQSLVHEAGDVGQQPSPFVVWHAEQPS